MNQNKEKFKDDIEKAERYILIVSWIGVVSAFALIGCAMWRIV
tara:strand:+ start:1838 stop:1966 length:129 start_codon:yes stop_codon:yes gene_type:complete